MAAHTVGQGIECCRFAGRQLTPARDQPASRCLRRSPRTILVRSAPMESPGSQSTGNSLSMGRHGNSLTASTSRCSTDDGSGWGNGTGKSVNGGDNGDNGDYGSGRNIGPNEPHPMRMWTFLFAAMLAVGGVAAFVRKGSLKSLGVSTAASTILTICARSMLGPTPHLPVSVACGVTIMLFFEMSGRYSQTQKFMPAGLVAGCSLLMCSGFFLNGL